MNKIESQFKVITPPESKVNILATDIKGLLILERPTSFDNRGFFREVLEARDVERSLDIRQTIIPLQWNHSYSVPGVIRGFHAEPWNKCIYVATGNVLGVWVDLRIDSPTFGKAEWLEFGEDNRKTIYLPEGIANSFCVVGDKPVNYLYQVTEYYEGKPTPAIVWNDPDIVKQFGGWPVPNPIIGKEDAKYPTLRAKFDGQVNFDKYPWLQD